MAVTLKSRRLRLVGGALADAPSSVPAPEQPPLAATIGALPDAQLVSLGAHKNIDALEALYRRHAAYAFRLAARIQGSNRDLEDIVHDAFIRAFEHLDDLQDGVAFKAWFGSIVVHSVRSRLRRLRVLTVLGLGRSEPVDMDAIASSEASPAVRAQIAQVYALLGMLETDERIAWTLRHVEGHDLDTVARLTRCSLATAKRRIARTQRFLDEHFVNPSRSEVHS